MNNSNYCEKHKRTISPILKTTSEDRKILHHNKENYIQYLEQQLEKAATMIHKKYEQKLRGIEQLIEEHDEKLQNFIKLIKLLQNFAETQEQENIKITRHINTKMEELYSKIQQLKIINCFFYIIMNQVTLINNQMKLNIDQSYWKQLNYKENNQILRILRNLLIIRQNAQKVDYSKLEQRIINIETKSDSLMKIQDNDKQNNGKLVEQQLYNLKLLIDILLKDQDDLKNNVQNLHIDFNQYKGSLQTQNQRQSRNSVAQQSEGESIMKPKLSAKDNIITKKKNKRNKSLSRSLSNKKPKDNINQKLNQIKTNKHGLCQKY